MNNNIEIKDLYYKYLNTESTTLNNINLDGDVDLGIARDLSFKFDSSKNPDEIDINFNNILVKILLIKVKYMIGRKIYESQ